MKNLDLVIFEKWWEKNFYHQLEKKNIPSMLIEQFKGVAERGWNARYFYERDELNVE